jgi:hypothetical protein
MSEEDLETSVPEEQIPDLDELNDQEEWGVARTYLKTLGPFSELFTGVSRTLVHCYEQENGKLSKVASGKLQRLFGSPSMLSQLFFATKTYYPKEIEARQSIEGPDLIFFVNLYELSLFFCIGYTTRRLAKSLPAEEWKLLLDKMQIYCDLAYPLGNTIPIIGPSRAMMAAAGRFIGFGIFNLNKPKKFKRYRVDIKTKSEPYDLKQELEIFGTTHLHIAALVWQKFGFGVRTCEEYVEGLLANNDDKISVGAQKFRVADAWLSALVEKKELPSEDLGKDYEIQESLTDSLVSLLSDLITKGSPYSWLSKSRDDIGPEKTPDLTADYEALRKAAEIKKR